MKGSVTAQTRSPPLNLRLFLVYLSFTLIVPAFTIGIEALIALDPSFRTNLQIDLQNFHLYQLFTSSFVHLDFSHFVGNVTAYLILIMYGLVLATMLNRKRLYLALTKIIVLVFLVFGAFFAFFNITTVYYAGLSGIDAALAGLLLLFWLMFLEHKTQKRAENYFGAVLTGIMVLFLAILLRYMFLYHNTREPLLLPALITITLVLLAGEIFVFRHQLLETFRDLKIFSRTSQILTLSIIAVFAYFVWNIFPESLGHSTRVASISLHLAGIVLGIIAGYIFMIYLVRIAYFHGEPGILAGQQDSERHSSLWNR